MSYSGLPRVAPLASLAAAGALAASIFVSPLGRAAHTPSAEGQRLAAATDNADATRAALAVMESGGNAVDGAIAAALALGVVGPSSSGIGGGGFALVYHARDKKVTALDFRETAPAKLSVDVLASRDWRHEDPSTRGVSVGVPGEPAGLEWLSRRFAKRSLADDAAPAVALADRGFLVGRNLAHVVDVVKERLGVSPELAAQFLPSGNVVPFGALVRRPDLARTLSRFGAEGSKPFYGGDIAHKIARAAQAAGGQLDATDLATYEVKERPPLERTVDKRTVVTMPAPSAGGLMVLEALLMYGANGASPLKAMGYNSSAYLHTVAEAMRGAVGDRVRFASDPDLQSATLEAYEAALAPSQLAARKKRILPNATHKASDFRTREEGTTHVIVADADGNVVSLTTTVNAPFGARIVAADTGIVLNDELDDFTHPKDLAGFGVIGLGPNRPRPNARPVSSMAPTIVLEGGEPILALGGSGGERIATAVTQMALCRLVFGLDPSACLASSRVHVSASPEMIIEPDMPEDVRAGLRARGEKIKEVVSPIAPAVQIVAWERGPSGSRLLAASDPRKSGFAAAQ